MYPEKKIQEILHENLDKTAKKGAAIFFLLDADIQRPKYFVTSLYGRNSGNKIESMTFPGTKIRTETSLDFNL